MKTSQADFAVIGGVHPEYRKELSSGKSIETMPVPKSLTLYMSQHLGAPAAPAVKKGDAVLKGGLIGKSAGFVSASVHSPVSGKVTAVDEVAAPSGAFCPAVVIEPDGEDRPDPSVQPRTDWQGLSRKELITLVADAGIVGMGGAGFPTHVKLSPPAGKTIDTLIINGAECEPYLTADHRLMVEQAGKIWAGAKIIRSILGAKSVRIAVEDNKPDAIAAMEKAMSDADDNAGISVLRTEYPKGAEKQQIYAITGRKVPAGGLPMDVGALVENVGTTAAVFDAVANGIPLIERVTTVTGSMINRPCNVLVRIGCSYADLVAFAGGLKGDPGKVISGGPMMGLAQASLDVFITKTASGLLVMAPGELDMYSSMPCISCGRCVRACPMNLLPCDLSQMLEAEDYDAAGEYGVMDCIECGCCAYECPAHRPLVQHMRQGKTRIIAKRKAAQAVKSDK